MTKKLINEAAKNYLAASLNNEDVTLLLKADAAKYSDQDITDILAEIEVLKESAGATEDAAVTALPQYDIFNVEAVRKDGKPEVVALKILSLEKTIPLTADALSQFNSFTVNTFGQRAVEAGTKKPGDELKIDKKK